VRRKGKRDPDTIAHLPIPAVKQRAFDDVEVTVTYADGHAELHWFRPGAVEWLIARYDEPTAVSGQPWMIRLARPNGNGEKS
jgi:hypothetical protein